MAGPLFKDSGQTAEERAKEANKIVFDLDLRGAIENMEPHERRFVTETADRLHKFGLATIISVKQLFWLRDLMQKYL